MKLKLKRYFTTWVAVLSIWLVCLYSFLPAEIKQAIIPAAAPTANRQGSTGTKFLIANGSFTATNLITTDASGNAIDTGSPGAPPTGTAGGDLSGSYPNPTVTNLSNVTNASLSNLGLQNNHVIVNTATCTLGNTDCDVNAGAAAHSVALNQGSTQKLTGANIGTAGRLLIDQGAGADPSFNASSGDVTNTSAGVFTIGNGVVTNAKLANPATTANGQTCTLGSTCNVNVGAAAHSVSLNQGNGSAMTGANIGTAGRLLIDQGAGVDPSFNASSGDVTNTSAGAFTIGNGVVTNAKLANSSLTYNGQAVALGATGNVNAGAAAHSVSLNQGNGSAITGAAIGTAGRLLIDQGAGADPSFNASSGDVTNTSAGVFTIANAAVTNAKLANSSLTYNGQTVSLGSTGNVNSGAAAHSVSLNQGNGSAMTGANVGTAGRLLIDQGAGADPSFNALSQDCTVTSAGVITCTKSNNVLLSTFATATGAVNPQTATYQVVAADFSNLKVITVASGTFTITLVASGTQPANGQYIDVVNYGSGVVTIARSGQNVNGGTASLTLSAGSATNPTSAEIASDGTNYFASVSGVLANSSTTVNGQTCTLGSTCNVNAGAAAHSVSLNQGNGSAMTGAAIGTAGRLLIDQGAGADPSFNASSGDVTNTSAGVFTIANLAVTTAKIAANAVTSAKVDGSVANQTSAAITTLTDGATVTWAIGSVYEANAVLTFTVHSGSRTLNLTGLVTAGQYLVRLVQDGTGGENLTGGTGCTWKQSGGGGSTFTLTATANAVDMLGFFYDGTTCWAILNKNFA